MSWKPRNFNAPQAYVSNPTPKHFYNGVAGNDDFQTLPKPTNLSNSAVSKMLKENERSGGSAIKEVLWPPPHEEDDSMDEYQNNIAYTNNVQNSQAMYNGVRHKKPSKPFQAPPTTIPLRASPPISQTAAPVYRTQPVPFTHKGGSKMRGDQKWPPAECKAQMEAERLAELELARGPLHKPMKAKKDYSSFFAKNAIPDTYPGYKAPPGTQHYVEEPVSYY